MGMDPLTGVPVGNEMLTMQPPGSYNLAKQQLAESGLDMQFWGAVAAIGGTALGLYGASKSASAAKDQARSQNEQIETTYKYDTALWKAKKDQLKNQYKYNVESLKIQKANDKTLKKYQYDIAIDKWEYDTKIQDARYAGEMEAFNKSQEIYAKTLDSIDQSRTFAVESQYAQFKELINESRYEAEENEIKAAQAKGNILTVGGVTSKLEQTEDAKAGRVEAQIGATVESGYANAKSAIQQIARDADDAKLKAYANKMLQPSAVVKIPKPKKLPAIKYQAPQKLTSSSFGPKPMKGAKASVSAAGGAAWGAGLSSIGGSILSFGLSKLGGP